MPTHAEEFLEQQFQSCDEHDDWEKGEFEGTPGATLMMMLVLQMLVHTLVGRRWWLKQLGTSFPGRKLILSCVLASAWPSLRCCGKLGSICLCISSLPLQTRKIRITSIIKMNIQLYSIESLVWNSPGVWHTLDMLSIIGYL